MKEVGVLLAVLGITGAVLLITLPTPQSSDKGFMERMLPAGPPAPPSWLR